MAKGWITLERDITDHWLWEEEPFTKAQAWIDLLLHANHKPARIKIKGRVLNLNIGQQARSEVTLAATWKWSRNKVRRFLKLLKTEQMIDQQTIQQTSVISICNYKEYQHRFKQGGTADETADGTGGGTGTGQASEQGRDRDRHTEEQCNHENHETSEPSESADADPPPPEKPEGAKSKWKYTADHFALADRMANPVLARFPSQKINPEEWADAVRKLDDLDGHTLENIAQLWAWIVRHETGRFSWAENCRTPMKLREKKDGLPYFDVIQSQMLREVNPDATHQPNRRKSLAERDWEATQQALADIEAREADSGFVGEDAAVVRPQVGESSWPGET